MVIILIGIIIISIAVYKITFKNTETIQLITTEQQTFSTEQQIIQETTTSYPVLGENIGTLSIPVLSEEMPIIEGTGVTELENGVGHFVGSVLPGIEDNCVFSAHRDTYFARLGELKLGDQLIIYTSNGTFTYQIQNIKIVDKDDRTVIVPTDSATLTLTTCYPFTYFGNAPDRYIVTSLLIKRE